MLISDIKRVVEQVSKDKGINTDVLIKTLEEALTSAARKILGRDADIEVQYNEEAGEIEVFQFKEVVETIESPELEISIEDGRKLDPDCEIGDSLGSKVDTSSFGRIAAQSAKQVIIQKMKDAERDAVYSSFIDRKGEIINGIVQRIDRGNIIVNLGHTEGILTIRDQIPKENYRRGDRIRALIKDVLLESRGPQIILTRASSDFLISLFKTEVPEIMEGVVTIEGAAREPGARSKIAVSSTDSDIDPVGACVGMKGSRVQNVVQELRGEKIDIIPWHIDAAKFICNALAPAEISKVIIDEDNHSMEVIVQDDYLSVAIGKRGQNVRLASALTGWQLDVINEESYSSAVKAGYNALLSLPGVTMSIADALHEKGFFSALEVAEATVEELEQIKGIGKIKAETMIEAATNYEPPVEGDSVNDNGPGEAAGDETPDDTPSEDSAESEDMEGADEPEGDDEPEDDDEPEVNDEPKDDDEPEDEDEPEDDDEPEDSDETEDASEPEDPDKPVSEGGTNE